MWLLMASAFADGGHMASYADAETSFSALERYRRRPALYDLGTASAIRREQRWGIGLGLEEQGLPSSPADAAPDPPREHRSGVGGVPFYNLAEVLDEQTLGREVMGALRRRWWGGDGSTSPFVPRLAAALEASAHPSTRDVLLTFANSGYLDFVLNGFPRSVVPHTLVVALDAHAQRALEAAGHTAYFEPRLPPIQVGQQMQGSHAFMDIMKLRLLCAAEALVLGYNVLLTDADAVFMKPPWAALEAAAALSVACDATVVPRSWRLAPGMVMAGFWYAKGLDPAAIGSAASASTNSTATDSPAPPALPASSSLFPSSGSSRPIIFLLEVLEYQAHHPSQHDQQAFNQILSELLTADMRVAVLHPRLFPNGFQYFVRRSTQRAGLKPVVVQNNWMMGADNKRHRFREAHLWSVDPPWYYSGSAGAPLRLLTYDGRSRSVTGLRDETSGLRAALRLGALLNRTVILPKFCEFMPGSGLVPPPPLTYRDTSGRLDPDVLDDDVDGDWCTAEWFYDMEALTGSFSVRESSFEAHPAAAAALAGSVTGPTVHIAPKHGWESGEDAEERAACHVGEGEAAGAEGQQRVWLEPASLTTGATDEELVAWFTPYAHVPVLRFGQLSGRFTEPSQPSVTEATRVPTAAAGPAAGGTAASPACAASLDERLLSAVRFRDEMERLVRSHVALAAPFECLCIEGVDLGSNLTAHLAHFVEHVPRATTVFVAGHRVDLHGLQPFRALWETVHTLSLYDWNGAGLHGRQTSSAINRRVCHHATRVHSIKEPARQGVECL